MNCLERPATGYPAISQTRLSRRRFLQLAGTAAGTTVAAGPLLIPHIAEQALRQITPVPGEKVDFHAYFKGFRPLAETHPLYTDAYRPLVYEPYPFTQTKPDNTKPFGSLHLQTDQDISLDLVLPSRPTNTVSLHPLLVRVDEQKQAYFFPLVQSIRPSRQHMRLVLGKGEHHIAITPLSDGLDQSTLAKPELSIVHGTPFQEALQNILPVFNVRPDLLSRPTKDALLFGFTTLHSSHDGTLAIQQHVVATSEESNMSVTDRYQRFGRTIDFETIEVGKTRFDSRTGQIDEEMLADTAIIQVRGHEWRRRPTGRSLDQIAETDNLAGLSGLTHLGLAPSLTIFPAGWKNLDLVEANPEMQILGFWEEAHKRDLFFRGFPNASQMADELLLSLRQNPKGIYPTIG